MGGHLNSIIETAVKAAMRAGEIQMSHFRKDGVKGTRLPHDIKSETDTASETEILSTILGSFPDHAVLTEENGMIDGDGDCLWIVDPLDGTVNFWHGIPFFCVSIACCRNNRHIPKKAVGLQPDGALVDPFVGVVFLPYMQELFMGVLNKGSTLNGNPIQISNANNSEETLVSLSFGKTPETMQHISKKLTTILPNVRKVRSLGAAAAELAYLAAGFFGGLIFESLRPWDFAAGKVIVEEAGGIFNAEETKPGVWRVYGYTPYIQENMTRLLLE
jgi:fructose-1,6-bisphosphatase/inositol monophosphatase family enzyme